MSKLYVLLRTDLSKNYASVQAGHAVAQFCIKESLRYHWNGRDVVSLPWRWENQTLIYLKGGPLEDLEKTISLLAERNAIFVAFKEPDLDYETTAVAVLSTEEVDELMQDLPLV